MVFLKVFFLYAFFYFERSRWICVDNIEFDVHSTICCRQIKHIFYAETQAISNILMISHKT